MMAAIGGNLISDRAHVLDWRGYPWFFAMTVVALIVWRVQAPARASWRRPTRLLCTQAYDTSITGSGSDRGVGG